MLILGIESSCDETAASVARDHTEILSNVVSSQVEEHKQYGGVVPEIASRRHCENVLPVVQKDWHLPPENPLCRRTIWQDILRRTTLHTRN